MNLRELVEKQAETYKDKIFIYWMEEKISYSQFNELTNKVANLFYELGVRKGDVVSVFLPNMLEYAYLYLGIPKLGAVIGPVNALFKPRELQYVVNNSEAKIIVTIPALLPIVNETRKDLPLLKYVIVIGEPAPNTLNFKELMNKASTKAPPAVKINEKEDASAILYTSGTTGFPKGVLQTHFNIRRNAEMIKEHVKPKDYYRFMLILPLFHVNAQLVTLMTPFVSGASCILTPGFSAKTHWDTVAKYKATTFSGVPTILSILLKMPHENLDLSSLEFIICGASPLPVEVMKEFEKTFKCKIVEGYGLTESTCAASVNPLPTEKEDKRKIGSIGIPLPGTKMKIVDAKGKDVAPGVQGEILIKGDHVMKGYYKNPEANKATLVDGWLHTGDAGYMDKDGIFFIKDRLKDMIKRGGENVYPREIEEVLYAHPAVALAAVVGAPDKIYDQVAKAFIVLKAGQKATAEEIIAHCKKNLANFKVPQYVEFREDLPKNSTGKILKHELK